MKTMIIWLSLAAACCAEPPKPSTIHQSGKVTYYKDRTGRVIGSSKTTNTRIEYRDSSGKTVGTSKTTTNGRSTTTRYYDKRGSLQGSTNGKATAPPYLPGSKR